MRAGLSSKAGFLHLRERELLAATNVQHGTGAAPSTSPSIRSVSTTPCPSRGGGTGVPAKADSENITAAPRLCAGANIPWRGAEYKGMSGRIQPCNHGPQFSSLIAVHPAVGVPPSRRQIWKNGGTRTRHGFPPSVCGIMPDKQFQTVGVIIQLHLLLELPRRHGIMLQYKVLVIQGEAGSSTHMSRGVMRRYGMERFFCGAGTVPYTPPSSKMPAGERKSPPSSPALRRREADAPAPDQPGFSQTRRKRTLHHHPAARPLLQKAQLHMGAVPAVRGTHNHLAAIRGKSRGRKTERRQHAQTQVYCLHGP